ncbi:MAG: helix-turn-helix domain-containing protein [Clostridiales bacterium]
MNKKNCFSEIDYKNLKDKSILILPFEHTKINDWIEYDSRSSREKAILMFLKGRKTKNIAKRLNVNINQVRSWTLSIYDKEKTPPANFKLNTNLRTPNNFSSWNSNTIYNFWNSFNTRQKA